MLESEDLLSQIYTGMPYTSLVELITPFCNENGIEEVLVAAFHIRNIHGGFGERQLFRDILSILYDYDRGLIATLLPVIPQYGYWKDIFYFSMTLPNFLGPTLDLCARQIVEDEYRVSLGYRPSLMAKYIPKQHKRYKVFANSFAKLLYPNINCHSLRMAKTRARISALNRLTGAVEVAMCAGQWASIDPRRVSTIARNRYHSAFLNRTDDDKQRKISEDREACRERFLQGLTIMAPPEPVSVRSEVYTPVRERVQFWLKQDLLSMTNDQLLPVPAVSN